MIDAITATDTATPAPSRKRPRKRRAKGTSGAPCKAPAAAVPGKLAAILRPSNRADTLTPEGASPHMVKISGNWGDGAVVEMITRGAAGGAHMSTRITRNAAFGLPIGTTRVDLWVAEGGAGASLNVIVEPIAEPPAWRTGAGRRVAISDHAQH